MYELPILEGLPQYSHGAQPVGVLGAKNVVMVPIFTLKDKDSIYK